MKLIYEINNVKYILFNVPVTRENATKVEAAIEECTCINQGLKEFKTSFFSPTLTVWNILVPEHNVNKWNNSKLV